MRMLLTIIAGAILLTAGCAAGRGGDAPPATVEGATTREKEVREEFRQTYKEREKKARERMEQPGAAGE